MPLSPEEQRKRQEAMFGMSMEDVITEKPGFEEPGMYAMMILSDAQEALSRSGSEETREKVRKWINKAKYWIDQCRPHRR